VLSVIKFLHVLLACSYFRPMYLEVVTRVLQGGPKKLYIFNTAQPPLKYIKFFWNYSKMETLDDLVGVIFCYEIRLIFRRVSSAKYEANCTILSLLLSDMICT